MPSFAVDSEPDGPQKKKPRKEQTSVFNFFAPSSSGAATVIDLTEQDNRSDENHVNGNIVKDAQKTRNFSIFCDLDGVLVDFNAGVKRLNKGKGVDVLARKQMWSSIARAGNFFLNLPWTTDGKVLWNKIVENGYYPSILTGIPFIKGSREQKFSWCERELKYAFDSLGKSVIFNHVDYASPKNGHERKSGSIRRGENIVNVITCWSQNKHFESGAQKVLIDDREDIGVKWTEKGGIFIHHITVEGTIAKMVEKGILTVEMEQTCPVEAVVEPKRKRESDLEDEPDNAAKGAKKRLANKSTLGCEGVICIDDE
jgi:hypothetical protein